MFSPSPRSGSGSSNSQSSKNAPCLALHTLSLSQCRPRCCIAQHRSYATRRMLGDSPAQQLIHTVHRMIACPLLAAVTEPNQPNKKHVLENKPTKGEGKKGEPADTVSNTFLFYVPTLPKCVFSRLTVQRNVKTRVFTVQKLNQSNFPIMALHNRSAQSDSCVLGRKCAEIFHQS